MTVVYTSIGKCPVPPEWTTERVIQLLDECGHKILKVEEVDKKIKKAV